MLNKDISFIIERKDIDETGVFTGLASTFGGKPDSYGDIVQKGAFLNTIQKNGYGGNGIKMLWQHDTHTPIGVWEELVETSKGLQVRGRIATATVTGNTAYELLKMGAINSMSIGYDVTDFETQKAKDGKETRILKGVDLYEISLVTFPANVGARVSGVKHSLDEISEIKDIRSLERYLCEIGFSKQASKYVIHLCKQKEKREAASIILDTMRSIGFDLKKFLEEENV